MKKLLLILLTLSTLILSSCDKEIDTIKIVKERGYAIMGYDNTFAPMGFDENNEAKGFDIDLAKEIEKVIGFNIKFQPIDWNTKEAELKTGKIDLIWNGLSITEERKKEILFSTPYLKNRQVIVTNNENINSINDLKNKKVGVQKGSAASAAVSSHEIAKDIDLIDPSTYTLVLQELKNKTVDAIVIDEVMIRYLMEKDNLNYKILDENFGEEEYGIGFRFNDTEFKNLFDKALSDIRGNGKAEEVSIKWFKEDLFLIK